MNTEMIEYIVLIIVLLILLLAYFSYIAYDDQKKIKYYQKTLAYETDWDKYSTMVKMQKWVLFRKKSELCFLKFLVYLKGLVRWK